ncbi:MAG: biopolymer transporter ExbD [Halobacteriovoraceae bacterium]|jgi:biopolymer transport protein ExbD|nr:biopolymer transporter ExbD [Halobacteriovoraceae bacterium]
MRKKRFNTRKKMKEELDVDITSLLDILVILLVFLLKSYNASDLKLEVAKNINLPDSKSEQLGNMAVIVQVSGDKDLWINNNKIGRFPASPSEKVDLLYQALQEEGKKQDQFIKELEATAANNTDKSALSTRKANRKRVNIVMDQSLPYEVLRKVMHTSALAGFPEFKFIVQGNF